MILESCMWQKSHVQFGRGASESTCNDNSLASNPAERGVLAWVSTQVKLLSSKQETNIECSLPKFAYVADGGAT